MIFEQLLAIGFNYVAPYYREIEFNSDELEKTWAQLFIPVPPNHKFKAKYDINDLRKLKSRKLAVFIITKAPTGVEKMIILNI